MKKYDIATSIILFILGLILIFVPGGIITTVIRVFGLVIIVLGIFGIMNGTKNKQNNTELIYGVLIAVLGVVIVSNPEVIASIIPFILGVCITLRSLLRLQVVSNMKKNSDDYLKPLIINIITLILGVTLIFNPFKGAETLIRIIGIFLIVYSGLDILDYYYTRPKRIKVIK